MAEVRASGGARDAQQRREGISVVVPTADRAASLARVVASLAAQLTADDELVVVDNGRAPVDAAALERPASGALHVLRLPPRSGVSVARNVGAHHARGAVLVFADDDDELPPDLLQHVRACFAPTDAGVPRRGAAYPTLLRASGHTVDIGAVLADEQAALRHALDGGLAFGGHLAIDTETFWRVGGFRTDLPVSEDRALAATLLLAGHTIRALDTTVRTGGPDHDSLSRSAARHANRLPFLLAYFELLTPQRRSAMLFRSLRPTLRWRRPLWSLGVLIASLPHLQRQLLRRVGQRWRGRS